jgi:lipid A 3-O-deacylase
VRKRSFAGVAAGLILGALPHGVLAQGRLFDEVRFGVFQHDTGLIGTQREKGVDFNLEVLSAPLIRSRLLGSPRIVVGGVVNSAGYTDQAYVGIVGRYTLFRDIVSPHDGLFWEGTVGGDWNDGKINVIGTPLEPFWKSHGSRLLFRIGMGMGYRFDAKWSATLSFNHISNAGLAYPNEGQNDLGLVIGLRI